MGLFLILMTQYIVAYLTRSTNWKHWFWSIKNG